MAPVIEMHPIALLCSRRKRQKVLSIPPSQHSDTFSEVILLEPDAE